MRFTTAVATLLTVGSLASASVLPRVLDAYDLAQPVQEREVPVLQCDDTPLYTGKLKVVNVDGREVFAAFEGVRNKEGYQILDVERDGKSAREESFSFTRCTSSFMGYQDESNKAANVYFGRLQPTHLLGKRCVSADQLGTTDGRFIAAKCLPSDDSGQLTQFWSLTKQPASSGDSVTWYVNFLGKPTGESADFPGNYHVSKKLVGSTRVVKNSYVTDDSKIANYFMKLQA